MCRVGTRHGSKNKYADLYLSSTLTECMSPSHFTCSHLQPTKFVSVSLQNRDGVLYKLNAPLFKKREN